MQITGTSIKAITANTIVRFRAESNLPQDDRSSAVGSVQAAAPLDKSTDRSDQLQRQREVQALKNRDREVRNHEQAHLGAAGGIAVSGANYQYVTGPDGQRYATGGEVSIDTSAVAGDPAATLRKAESIRRAALSPAQPSAQDYRVASDATAMANKARIELFRVRQDSIRRGTLLDIRV